MAHSIRVPEGEAQTAGFDRGEKILDETPHPPRRIRHRRNKALLTGLFLLAPLLPALAAETAATAPPANTDCPAAFPATPPKDSALRRSEAERLAPYGEACRERPDYFAYYGALLLTTAQPQEAAIALEKALLLAPDLGGAQLDYAQALAELGEIASARQLADDIATRPDLPPGLQTWLIDQLGHWRGEGWRLAWSIDLMAGAETNLNSSPNIRTLTITLPGGNVPLELDTSETPIAGHALRSDLLLAAVHRLGPGVFQAGAEYLTRHSPGHDSTRYELGNLNLSYLHPLWGGQWGIRTEHTRIAIGDETAYIGNGWSLLYQRPAPWLPESCKLSLGQSGERREFPTAPHQNGRYTSHILQTGCRWNEWHLNLGLQQGKDRAADPLRLGGQQNRTDSTLGIGHRLGPGLLALTLASSRAIDAQAYSPLLGGMPRRIERLTTRLSWEHPLARHWSILGHFEHSSQNSNIELFGMRNRALYIGLRIHGN